MNIRISDAVIQYLSIASVALNIFLISYVALFTMNFYHSKQFYQFTTFNECFSETKSQSSSDIKSLAEFTAIYDLCNDKIYKVLFYQDFELRRDKLVQQELDERINLFLVVIVTLSGVVLAGIQLFMSYKIAVSGREYWGSDTSIAVKQGEISLKTSITGLAILIVSLAFFVVYVKWIYSWREVGGSIPATSPFAQSKELGPGGFGKSPSEIKATPSR